MILIFSEITDLNTGKQPNRKFPFAQIVSSELSVQIAGFSRVLPVTSQAFKSSYNPYISVWADEENYKSKKDCGVKFVKEKPRWITRD